MTTETFESYLTAEHGVVFKRDPETCGMKLPELGEGVNARIITKEPMYILIPKRWAYNTLATVGDDKYITCIFAMVFPESKVFSIVNQVNRIQITPDSVSLTKIFKDEYFKFNFEKDGVVFPLLDLNQEDTLAYPIYDEIIAKGNVPIYLRYEDTTKVLKSAPVTAGINMSPSNVIFEATVATISRDLTDRKKYYRLMVNNQNYQLAKPPAIIGLRNVILGATNFTTRLTGSYAEDGIESSLINPSTHREGVEDILRI